MNLLRRPEVETRVRLKRSALYNAMAHGRFPKPIRLSATRVAWLESDVDDWLATRLAERDAAGPKRG